MNDLQSERKKILVSAPQSSVWLWGSEGCGHRGHRGAGEAPVDEPLRECSRVINASVNPRTTGSLQLVAQV